MHHRIEGLVSRASQAGEQWRLLTARWAAASLPEDVDYTRLHSATFREFDKRVITTLDLVRSIGQTDEASQLLFLPKVDSVAGHLGTVHSAIGQLLSELNNYSTAEFKDPSGNLDSLQAFVDGVHKGNVNSGGLLDQISTALTILFDLASTGLKFGKGKNLSLYHSYGEQLRDMAHGVAAVRGEVLSLKAGIDAYSREASEAAESAVSSSAAAEKSRLEVDAAVVSVKAFLAEAEAKLASIRETARAASSLQTQVDNYAASFDAFQKSLDDRVAAHDSFVQEMAKAKAANREREEDIRRIIEKSDAMIKGATTAGLGNSLEETRALYQKRMRNSGLFFVLSIFFLAASAVPLVAHILPGLFEPWLPRVSAGAAAPGGNGEAWLALFGKVFLLFPGTWLTQFFSKAYSQFFHLEREYAHKAALARSVEGFKKQAPNFEEEITAAVFFEVQTNPSRNSAPEAAEHPILGPIVRKFMDSLPTRKSPSGDSSSD